MPSTAPASNDLQPKAGIYYRVVTTGEEGKGDPISLQLAEQWLKYLKSREKKDLVGYIHWIERVQE